MAALRRPQLKGTPKTKVDRRDPTWPVAEGENAVSEFAADLQGALSPFGDGDLPLPVESLGYAHPGPGDRPNR